jgi:hypothetical protein
MIGRDLPVTAPAYRTSSAQRVDVGTAERIDAAYRRRQPQRLDDAVRDIVDEDRLEARIGARERHHGDVAQQRREEIEELVFPAEDHRGRKHVQSRPEAVTIASASPLLRRYWLGPPDRH